MSLIYNFCIRIYTTSIYLYSFFNKKAKKWICGRKNIFNKLKNSIGGNSNIIWIHCSSLGEFEQVKPLIVHYKKKYTKHKILLTFFSPSGYEVQKNFEKVNWVFYLPADLEKNCKVFLDIVNPLKAIFVKNDFWFNYIRECNKRNIPLYFVSTTFRKNQYIFKSLWAINQLKKISHIFVNDNESAQILKKVNINKVSVNNDLRFDNVKLNRNEKLNSTIQKWKITKKKLLIFGSIHKKDEKIIYKFIKENNQFQYIIAPHEIGNTQIIAKKINGLLYSEIKNKTKNKAKNNKNILIIDNIGLLSSLYQAAEIAYVGGGFCNGVHNILEPVTFGVPVIFGPNYNKDKIANIIIKKDIGKSINNFYEFEAAIKSYLSYDKNKSINFVDNRSGSTELILSKI